MKNILPIIFALLLSLNIYSKEQVKIIEGDFTAPKTLKELTVFTASAGDVLDIYVESLHKRKTVSIKVEQHPGGIKIFDFDEIRSETKQIQIVTDAIYRVTCVGSNVDFKISLTNSTDKPNGSDRGEYAYVRIPDTSFVSGYVNYEIGNNISYTPYKEKVLLNCTRESETVVSKHFQTGSDIMLLDIPADSEDEFQSRKLISYSINLTTDSPDAYGAMLEVIKVGIDEFTPGYSPSVFKKSEKFDSKTSKKVIENFVEESEKVDKIGTVIDVGNLGFDTYNEANNDGSTAAVTPQDLENMSYLPSEGVIEEILLSKVSDIPGVSNETSAIIESVLTFPDPSEILSDGLDKIAPKIDGSSIMNAFHWKPKEISAVDMEAVGAVIIQSANNFGKDRGGYWDISGSPQHPENGQNISVWELNDSDRNSIDRKFKFKEVPGTDGEYYYILPFGGSTSHRLDCEGGPRYNKKDGTDILVWENGEKMHLGQIFKVIHLGNGKVKILSHAGHEFNLDARSSKNGSKVHLWSPGEGSWTEWYLLDPATLSKVVPKAHSNKRKEDIGHWQCVAGERGKLINKTIEIADVGDPIVPQRQGIKMKIEVKSEKGASKATLGVVANYMVTNYTEVIKYAEYKTPIKTKDFWTSYKINYRYAIMFKDQMKPYYKEVPKTIYYGFRSKSEPSKSEDPETQRRLDAYETLTSTE